MLLSLSRRYGDRAGAAAAAAAAAGPGYNPNPAYSTNTMYRNSTYPTFATRQQQQQQQQQYTPTTGNGSDYDVSKHSTHAYNNSGGHLPHAHAQHHQQQQASSHSNELTHNLYNLNLNRTSCYKSTDELKQQSPVTSGHSSEHYDSFPASQQQQYNPQYHPGNPSHANHVRGLPRTGSFEDRGSATSQYDGYYSHQHHHGSLDREKRLAEQQQQHQPDHMIIPELIPSKFGSKRESHSDRRDSPYYNGPGATAANTAGLHDGAAPYASYSSTGTGRHHHHQQPVPAAAGIGGSIPFIDSSHSSLTSSASSNNYYYDGAGNAASSSAANAAPRQQNPPSTPQFESPPVTVLRHESPQPHHHHYSQAPHGYESPQIQPPPNPAGLPNMTVTKYSNFVEVSKPFEMADVYKYSEKIRKTRNGSDNGPNSPAHSSASGSSSARAQSPMLTRAVHVTSSSRSRSASPLPPSGHHGGSGDHTKQYLSSQYHAAAANAPSHAHASLGKREHYGGHHHHAQHAQQALHNHHHSPVNNTQTPYKLYHSSSQPQIASPANQQARHIQYHSPQPQSAKPIGQNSQGHHSTSSTPHRWVLLFI